MRRTLSIVVTGLPVAASALVVPNASVTRQGEQLGAHEPHLACQLHRGLAQEVHAGRGRRIEDDDRLAEHQAVLRAPERDRVDADIGSERLEAGAQRCGRVAHLAGESSGRRAGKIDGAVRPYHR